MLDVAFHDSQVMTNSLNHLAQRDEVFILLTVHRQGQLPFAERQMGLLRTIFLFLSFYECAEMCPLLIGHVSPVDNSIFGILRVHSKTCRLVIVK